MQTSKFKKAWNKIKVFFSEPSNCFLVIFFILFLGLSVYPLLATLKETVVVHAGIEKTITGLKKGDFTFWHFQKLFTWSDWSIVSFYEPLLNSFLLGLLGSILAIVIGGGIAWLLARSNLKCKKLIGALFMFPYMMPAWTLAQFWLYMFQNTGNGGATAGVIQGLFGICMPQWFVYGLFPCVIVNGLHFAPFAYILIGGILKNMDATLEESATILKTKRWKILWKITFPITLPAILSTFLLCFCSGFASYSVPLFLGGAVRFYTLSSKMMALMNSGYMGQGYIIAAVMIVVGITILLINQRFTNKRKAFTTVTGKSGQVSLVNLRKGNIPTAIIIILLAIFFSVIPLVIFFLQTVMREPNLYQWSNFTWDFWVGTEKSMGMVGGILLNQDFWMGLLRLILLALACSIVAGTFGLLIGYSCVKQKRRKLSKAVEALAFFPYLIPTTAFAAIFLALASTEAFAFLYNSFFLLVLVGGLKYLPYASRGGINSMLQISPEIEEAAVIMGVPWWKRLFRILVPIQKTSILSGYFLPIVSTMREVDLFTLLVPSSTYLLTTQLLSYNQTGYDQYASAITLVIIVLVLIFNAVSSKLTGASIANSVSSSQKK